MVIPPIGAVSGVGGVSPVGGVSSVGGTSAAGGAGSGAGFGKALDNGLQNVQSLNNNADNLAVKAATGDLSNVSAYTVAATQANLATSLTVAVQSKALQSFKEIMGMQV